jgi:hypothetical protein
MGYVMKLGQNGSCIWDLPFGGMGGTASGTAISVQPTGDFAFAATYSGAQTTGPGLASLPDPNGIDAFVAHCSSGFDPSQGGVPVWYQHFGDTGDQVVTNIVLDQAGGVFVAGSYTESLESPLPNPTLNKMGTMNRTGFVVLLNSTNGAPLGQTSHLFPGATGNVDLQGLALTTAGTGVVAIAGRVVGSLDFGNGPETPATGDDAFFGQYDKGSLSYLSGTWLADVGNQETRHVDFNPAGDLYVSGSFVQSLNFMNGVTLKSNTPAAFLAHVDGTGKAEEAFAFGSVDTIDPHPGVTFAVDPTSGQPTSGDVVFAGALTGKVAVGGTMVTANPAIDNIVVGRLDASLATARWLRAYPSTSPQGADAVAIDPQGDVFVAGHFQGKLAIPGGKDVTLTGATGVFVAKLEP